MVVVDWRAACRQAEVARGLDLAQTLTERAPVGVAIVRVPDWFVLYANHAYGAMTGAGPEDLSDKSLAKRFERPRDPMRLMERLMDCGEFHNMEVPLVHRDGERVWALVSGSRTAYRSATAGMLVFNRISEHRQLRELASYDPLTGLPNRNQLWEQLRLAMTRASRSGQLAGVLFIDLDGFKQVNDCYGHQSGDQLLATLAQRFSRAVRATDTVARIGGDEFVILLEQLDEPAQAEQAAKHVMRTLSEPVELMNGRIIKASASIGIALYPTDGDTGDDLLQCSDLAMYRAKRAGPGRIQSNTSSTCVTEGERSGLG